ncbi:DinB family protein [Patiriisocius hiemis]|uniref:DinB family protein n=1 Tax=Patiriisocius hiemis TaxID=3075604 RepID=A0ABU2YCV7_9FLAO|nr:DinB family protein [Constantimarinum sp. W242]MDT0554893.1 DinB family protein [Constantimarinum sp. W242]
MITDLLEPTEFNPYFAQYINLASSNDILESLAKSMLVTHDFFENISKEKLNYRYADGKWTPLQVLLHIIDTERVFAYRALYFARSNGGKLVGFDQDEFIENTSSDLHLDELLKEFIAVRTATISLFKSFNENTLKKKGIASGNELSVRAAGYIICGHEVHHINIIKERYL